MPLALIALAVATFAIGTTEFVIVGLIPGMATDLNVTVPTAGLLVSLYALSITIGTPIFTVLTVRFPRRNLMISLMAIFTFCNLAAALSVGYTSLLISRIIMGVAHGVFFGVGATVATLLVPKEKAGNALAVMMGGLTIAMVVGVPFGSWLGQLFNWRMPFLVVTALAAIALVGLVWLLPRNIAQPAPASFLSQLGLLGNRRLAVMYLITAVGFGSTFVVFTFLSPLLTDVTGVSASTVNIALMLFGAATVIGNMAGGKLSDAIGTRKAMMVILTGLIVSLGLIPIAIHNAVAMLVVVTIWGSFAFAVPPVMQAGVVAAAEEVAPGAVGAASGFAIAAFNVGISGGSFIGGLLVSWPGLTATPYAAIAMAMIALSIVAAAMTEPHAKSRVRVHAH